MLRGAAEGERGAGSGDRLQSILASSLNSLGNFLSELGRREDALAAAQEATEIYRRRAAARPDAFLPDLATSLNNLGNRWSELGRREDSLAAAQEAVATLAPFFLRLPAAYRQRMAVMARNNIERSESLAVEPDAALLTPIIEALRKLRDSQEGADSNA
jgi:tetratricopeptide (TPR) repeat protein